MTEFHFIDDPNVLSVIDTILGLAGEQYNAPYDSSTQPDDATERNDAVKVELPGGSGFGGIANTAGLPNVGMVIQSVLMILAPFMAAYGLILPILGVLKGILEVLCCLMNPFCVIPAVARLLKKWVPALLSLFPPVAGAQLIMSVIKLLLAIIYFIITELIPTIQLIINNIREGIDAINSGDTFKSQAIQRKVQFLFTDLFNRLGIINMAKPVIEIVFTILRIFAGLPCGDDERGNNIVMHLNSASFFSDVTTPDTTCCTETQCPPAIKNPPTGFGLLVPKVYGDAPPLWSWQLVPVTGHERMQELRPFMQNMTSQLNPQLDEPIDEAVPAGHTYDAAHFRLRIAGARADIKCGIDVPVQPGEALVPIAAINPDNSVIVTNTVLSAFQGVVRYCVEPDFNQLIARNIIGIGCHPDIEAAKAEVASRFTELGASFLVRNPDMAEIQTRFNGLPDSLECLKNLTNLDDADVLTQETIDTAQQCQDNITEDMLNFADFLIARLNDLLSRLNNNIASELDADKNIVGAGTDKAIISVTPRSSGGFLLAKDLPEGSDIDVEIITDFGILRNQQLNSSTGIVTAELLSPFAGTATVSAKINGEFVSDLEGTTEVMETEVIKFVSDAVLPKRRTVSKPSPRSKTRTGASSERDHGTR